MKKQNPIAALEACRVRNSIGAEGVAYCRGMSIANAEHVLETLREQTAQTELVTRFLDAFESSIRASAYHGLED